MFACSTTVNTPKYEYSYLYDSDQKVIAPKLKVFHHAVDSSILHFQIDSEDILYEKIFGDSTAYAKILMKYSVYESEDLKSLVDSGTFSFVNYGSNSKPAVIQNSIPLKMKTGAVYWLKVKFRDDHKDLNTAIVVKCDKRLNNNFDYYLLTENNKVIFDQLFSKYQSVTIEKSPLVTNSKFEVQSSNSTLEMTPPPFIERYEVNINFKIDTSYVVHFFNNKVSIENYMTLNRFRPEGDTTKPFNYFYSYDAAFPEITNIEEFIQPIRYISTSKEYNQVTTAEVPKKAVDAFWLKIGKNQERSKEIIREYYGRVESSNQNFTSYKEGWKTDRGIIWIVYGKPTSIVKTTEREIWTYGEANNILSTRFVFYKKENNLSNNDFELYRDSEYKNNWYRAVDLWRQAKIY